MRWAEYGPRVRFIAIPPRRICVDHPGLRVRQRETHRARRCRLFSPELGERFLA